MAYFSFSRYPRAGLLAAGLALLAASGQALLGQANTPGGNDGFDPNVNGIVNVVATQPDGKVIIGGTFTQLTPNGSAAQINRNNLARLNPDGSVDGSFSPQPNGLVDAIAVMPNGQILIGGTFTTVLPSNGASSPAVTRNGLARLNADGTLDTTFNPNPQGLYTSQVNAIALQSNGQIVIGGYFTSLRPNGTGTAVAVGHLARLNSDGSVDSTFNPNTNAEVSTLLVTPSGQILVGGGFTTIQPIGSASAIAAPFLARINADGTNDSTLINPNLNGAVLSIALQPDGNIILGGNFSTIQPPGAGGTTNVDFILRMSPTGTPDSTFLTNLSGPVQKVLVQSDGRILAAGLFTTITNGTAAYFSVGDIARLNRDGTPDMTFSPNANYTVNSMALMSDGRIVIGGAFSQLQPNNETAPANRNCVARLNADGTLDQDFNPNAFGGVGVLAVQTNGKILVGGSFSSINGVTRTNFARINADGTLDTTFAPAVNGAVYAVALQSDGKILIGGAFSMVNNTPIQVLARLNTDGTLDTGFKPNPNNGNIYAITVQPNGKIIVGGSFFGFGPAIGPPSATTTSIFYMGRINTDGSIDTTWQPNPTGPVYSIAYNASNNTVIFGGSFSSVAPIDFSDFQGGSYAEVNYINPHIALVDGTSGLCYASFLPNPNGTVYSIALVAGGQIVIGGNFTSLQPNPTSTTQVINGVVVTTTTPISYRPYIARINSDGTLDATFAPAVNGPVLSVAYNSTTKNVVIGGTFTTASQVTNATSNTTSPSVPRNYIARIKTDGTIDTAFTTGLNGVVDSVVYASSTVILAGGSFTSAVLANGSTVPAIHLIEFNDDPGEVSDDSINSALLSPFQASVPITSVAVEPNARIDVGGNFISIAGVYATNIARFSPDAIQDVSFYANANGPVNSFVCQTDGTYFAGGAFTSIGHHQANYFAHLNPDSTLDTTYSNFPDGPVNAIAAQTNVPAVIGGAFANVGTVAVANLARIMTNGTVDATFTPNPNGAVTVVVTQPNGQYLVAGAFTSIAGGSRNFLARLNANGTLDASFNPNPNAAVAVIQVQPDGKILVGGSFTTIGGAGRAYIARLNADGSVDSNFNPSANAAVSTIVLQAPGIGAATSQGSNSVDRILVGGSFTSMGGTAINYLARLNYDGTLDATFNPNPNGAVTALAIQADGKPLVAGSFSIIGGLPRNGFARLSNPEASQQSLTVSSDLSTLTFSMQGGPELANVTFEVSTDDLTWSTIGFGTRVGLANTWQLGNVGVLPANTNFYVIALGQSFTSNGSTTSIFGGVQQFYVNPTSDIGSAATASAVVGQPFSYQIAATNSPTTYTAANLPAGLTFNAATGVISGVPVSPGSTTVTLTATTAAGTTTGSLTITAISSGAGGSPVAPLSRLINLSTQSLVTPTSPLVAGFAVAGAAPKTVLIRAVGPGLTTYFGQAGSLSNPKLGLYNSSQQLILSNGAWSGAAAMMQIFAEFGAFPLVVGSADGAAVTSLSPGNYTAQVTSQLTSGTGSSGNVLAEIYDADEFTANLPQRIVNLSGRGYVDATHIVTGGFAITGTQTMTVLLRAVGPGLNSTFGIPAASVASLPTLQLVNGSNVLLEANTGWGNPVTSNGSYPAASAATIAADSAIVGAFPLVSGSADSAIVVTLPPGNYTAQVKGNGGVGTVLFEIYEISSP